jgi:predicted HTH domain antitoxin
VSSKNDTEYHLIKGGVITQKEYTMENIINKIQEAEVWLGEEVTLASVSKN